ncbi:hypothetical protein ACFVP3_09230 [Streptomyces sp. NPDC057806]|uniref:hypothetical protein n=1 Tax=Streptomyces sp. NPDC057806 TaxID=3346255 RepID=UPI0036908B6C
MTAAKRTTARRRPVKPEPVKCPDCDGRGEIAETVHVGTRKKRATDDQQAALCTTCWGSGEAPTD